MDARDLIEYVSWCVGRSKATASVTNDLLPGYQLVVTQFCSN